MRGGPLYSIRKYCVLCCGDQPREVRLCPAKDCLLYLLRFGKKPKGFRKSALKAIKERCYGCSGYETKRVKECDLGECSLHPYRLGKNPKREGKGILANINHIIFVRDNFIANLERQNVHYSEECWNGIIQQS